MKRQRERERSRETHPNKLIMINITSSIPSMAAMIKFVQKKKKTPYQNLSHHFLENTL